MKPKVEPAGNLKRKFAGWLALVVVASRSLGVQLPLPPRKLSILASIASAITLPLLLLLSPAVTLSPGFHNMDSPQDTPSADHHDDQQAKSSYVTHIPPSTFILSPLPPQRKDSCCQRCPGLHCLPRCQGLHLRLSDTQIRFSSSPCR